MHWTIPPVTLVLALATVVCSIMAMSNLSEEPGALWTVLSRGPLAPGRCFTPRGLVLQRLATLAGVLTLIAFYLNV
jgi:hypothetical protein